MKLLFMIGNAADVVRDLKNGKHNSKETDLNAVSTGRSFVRGVYFTKTPITYYPPKSSQAFR